jgi:hypothetical protein
MQYLITAKIQRTKKLYVEPVFKPRPRLGQKTQIRTKKMHFLVLTHK